MLSRPTQKLASKIKIGKRVESPLDRNLLVDWSANLFVADRRQYIVLSNTHTLYNCLVSAKGITNEATFIDAAIETIGNFMNEDGLGSAFEQFVLPACTNFQFKKTLNRSVTGSMTDLIFGAKIYITERQDLNLHQIAQRLNKTPLSALVDENGKKYNDPNRAIRTLIGKQ